MSPKKELSQIEHASSNQTSDFQENMLVFRGRRKPSWISDVCQGQPLNCIPLTCNDCRSTNQTQEPDIAVEVEAIERKKTHQICKRGHTPHNFERVFSKSPSKHQKHYVEKNLSFEAPS